MNQPVNWRLLTYRAGGVVHLGTVSSGYRTACGKRLLVDLTTVSSPQQLSDLTCGSCKRTGRARLFKVQWMGGR